MNTDNTFEEVSQHYSVTREPFRQIEAKALRKLKHPSRFDRAPAGRAKAADGAQRWHNHLLTGECD
jgi:hypothetical protein